MRYELILLVLYLSCLIQNGNCDTSNGEQKTYTIENWHVKFSISDKLKVDEFARISDISGRRGHIDLENDIFPDDSLLPLKDLVAFRDGNWYSSDGSDSMSEFESIYKIDTLKNTKDVVVFKMYVTIVNKQYQDTMWTNISRHVEGPIYYVEIPPKYYKELKNGRAFSIVGDSIITTDIIDDIEIN